MWKLGKMLFYNNRKIQNVFGFTGVPSPQISMQKEGSRFGWTFQQLLIFSLLAVRVDRHLLMQTCMLLNLVCPGFTQPKYGQHFLQTSYTTFKNRQITLEEPPVYQKLDHLKTCPLHELLRKCRAAKCLT